MRESEPYIERDTLDVIIYILTFTSDFSLPFFSLLSQFAHIVYTQTNENKSHVALLLQIPLTKPPPALSHLTSYKLHLYYNFGSTRIPNDSEKRNPPSYSSSSVN